MGPRPRGDRPLQDRLRRARGPLHRGLGPRPRPARATQSTRWRSGRGCAWTRLRHGLRGRRRRDGGRLRGRTAGDDDGSGVRELAGAELAGWDAADRRRAGRPRLPVARRGRQHRAAPRLAAPLPRAGDGRRALVLVRPWRGRAAAPRTSRAGRSAGRRGPSPGRRRAGRGPDHRGAGRPPLAGDGVDVLAADPEVAGRRRAYGGRARRPRASARSRRSSRRATGWRSRSGGRGRGGGLRRHREGDPPADPPGRARRRARRSAGTRPQAEAEATSSARPRRADAAFERFYGLLARDRRPARLRVRRTAPSFTAWWRRALAAGHLVYLEAREGGAGRRRPGRPRALPPRVAAVHRPLRGPGRAPARPPGDHAPPALAGHPAGARARAAARWTSGAWTCRTRGASRSRASRRFGLYEHKRSFGAPWVELAGAQERVSGRWRYAAGGRWPAGAVVGVAGRPMSAGRTPVERLVDAATPAGPRPLAGLVARLDADGLVARHGRGRPPSDAPPSRPSRSRASPRTRARSGEGRCSWPSPGSTSTATTTCPGAAAAGAAAAIVERPLPDAGRPAARRRPRPAGPRRRGRLVVRATRRASSASSASPAPTARPRPRFLAVAALEAAGVEQRADRHGRRPGSGDVPSATRLMSPRPRRPSCRRPCAPWSRRRRRRGHRDHVARPGAGPGRLGVAYDAAIFTNLTHEHLDLHGTFEAYRAAKLRLFEALAAGPANPAKTVGGRAWPKLAVVNLDDPSAAAFAAAAREAGRDGPDLRHRVRADVRATGVDEDAHSLRIRFAAPVRGRDPRPAARRPVQRPQRARGGRAGRGPGPGPGRGPCRPRGRARRPGPHGAHRRGAAVRGHRGLRALAGVARRACWSCWRRSPRPAAAG